MINPAKCFILVAIQPESLGLEVWVFVDVSCDCYQHLYGDWFTRGGVSDTYRYLSRVPAVFFGLKGRGTWNRLPLLLPPASTLYSRHSEGPHQHPLIGPPEYLHPRPDCPKPVDQLELDQWHITCIPGSPHRELFTNLRNRAHLSTSVSFPGVVGRDAGSEHAGAMRTYHAPIFTTLEYRFAIWILKPMEIGISIPGLQGS